MQPNADQTPNKKMAATIAVIIVTIMAVMSIEALSTKKATPTATPVVTTSTAATPTSSTQSSSTSANQMYKDGTYTVTDSYDSPGGQESMQVSLTIKNDIVTDSTVLPQAYDRDSREFQNVFIEDYKTYVVGKEVSSLRLNRISGASLTTQGFNDAVAQIKTQAKY
ncbi:MAG TPA: hypothetical protein VLF60_02050 [Candidatus Saccharimonadales bacterium]|nr:hypothetical protein [Candidatus Saccharimonadales bacterium]